MYIAAACVVCSRSYRVFKFSTTPRKVATRAQEGKKAQPPKPKKRKRWICGEEKRSEESRGRCSVCCQYGYGVRSIAVAAGYNEFGRRCLARFAFGACVRPKSQDAHDIASERSDSEQSSGGLPSPRARGSDFWPQRPPCPRPACYRMCDACALGQRAIAACQLSGPSKSKTHVDSD